MPFFMHSYRKHHQHGKGKLQAEQAMTLYQTLTYQYLFPLKLAWTESWPDDMTARECWNYSSMSCRQRKADQPYQKHTYSITDTNGHITFKRENRLCHFIHSASSSAFFHTCIAAHNCVYDSQSVCRWWRSTTFTLEELAVVDTITQWHWHRY